MWVIPKKLDTLAYVPATVELISDSQELCEILERSVLWKSKLSPSKTWLQRLKRNCSISRLFTQILKPSHSESFVDAWTSFLGASPANPSQSQGKKQGQKTLATFSHTFSMESENVGLPLFSLKMSKESFQVNSKEIIGTIQKERPFCSMSSENWRGWVTKRRQEYSARLKSVLLTNEKECSSSPWISPAAQASASQEPLFTKEGTPWRGEGRAYRKEGNGSYAYRTLTLPLQVQHIPQAEGRNNFNGSLKGRWTTPIDQQNYKGQLNPRWVETLMGLPIGWTMPSCADPVTIERMSSDYLGTEFCPIQQRKHSMFCGKTWPTPPASQRGKNYTVYLRKCINRVKAGGIPFAPTLQVSAENPRANTSLFKNLDLSKDTEQLIKEIKLKTSMSGTKI